jgi:hypothetical protein
MKGSNHLVGCFSISISNHMHKLHRHPIYVCLEHTFHRAAASQYGSPCPSHWGRAWVLCWTLVLKLMPRWDHARSTVAIEKEFVSTC